MTVSSFMFLVFFCHQLVVNGLASPVGRHLYQTGIEQMRLESKDGSLSLPYLNSNPTQPVVAKCNMAIVVSLNNASGLVVQKGIDGNLTGSSPLTVEADGKLTKSSPVPAEKCIPPKVDGKLTVSNPVPAVESSSLPAEVDGKSKMCSCSSP